MSKDYYDILGVGKNASKDEIKRAYRKLAHEHHPDKGGGEAQKFKELNEAYEALSDDAKRQQYDRFGQTFEQSRSQGASGGAGFGGFSDFARGFDFGGFSTGGGSAFSGDFSDIFSEMFGGGSRRSRRQQGIDLEMAITIGFLEAVFGVEKEIALEKKDACQHCRGEGGEPGSKIIVCPKCHGQGQIVTHRKTILGSIQSAETCDRCEGTGKIPEKPCRECGGTGIKRQQKKIMVKVPAGIDSGQRIRLSGEGEMGYRGSKPGDLYIEVRVQPHSEFRREGFNIITEVPVSFYQAALGAEVEIATVDGPVMLKVPAGTQSEKVFRLKGKGVPHLQGSARGDHLAAVRVVTPQKLTKKEKELLRELAAESGETVEVNKSFWGKIKDSF